MSSPLAGSPREAHVLARRPRSRTLRTGSHEVLMRSQLSVGLFATLLAGLAGPLSAQERGTGTVTGTITRQSDGSPLASVTVTVKGAAARAASGTDRKSTRLNSSHQLIS